MIANPVMASDGLVQALRCFAVQPVSARVPVFEFKPGIHLILDAGLIYVFSRPTPGKNVKIAPVEVGSIAAMNGTDFADGGTDRMVDIQL